MTEERWIVIPNWDRFQHYRDRNPPWIKLHRGLASNAEWLTLTGHQRAALIGLWLEYAISNRKVRDNTSTISRRIGLRVTRRTLNALAHAGFVEFSASRPLAPCKQLVSLEGEGEGEKKERKKKESRNGEVVPGAQGPRSVPAGGVKCPHCGVMRPGPNTLADHIANVHNDLTEPIGGDAS